MAQGSVTLKLVIYFVNICLATFDKVSHILYYYGQSIQTSYIKQMIFFFLLASPAVQIASWAIILGQIGLGEKFSDNIRVKNAKTQIQYYKLLITEGILFGFRLLWNVIKSIPLSICITFLQEIKIFPFVLFGYSYFNYKAILTTTIMNNIAPLIEEKRKIALKKKQQQIDKAQNMEKIQQTRRRGLNQINNFQDAVQQQQQIQPNDKGIQLSTIRNQSFNNSPLEAVDLSISNYNNNNKSTLRQSLLINNALKSSIRQVRQTSTPQQIIEIQDISPQINSPTDINIPNINNNQNSQDKQVQKRSSNLSSLLGSLKLPMNIINKNIKLTEDVQEGQDNDNDEREKRGVDQSQSDSYNEDESDEQESNYDGEQSNEPYLNKLNNQLVGNKSGFARVIQIIQNNNAQKRGRNSQSNYMNGGMTNTNKAINDQVTQKNAKIAGKSTTNNNNNNNNLDLLLEANCKPTIEMLVFDKNLTRFLQITNVIQTFFETLPLSILQYINNEIGNLWVDKHGGLHFFVILSFLSGCLMIIQFGIQLIQLLYGKNISIFYQTMNYLNTPDVKQNKADKSQQSNLGILFPMPSVVSIEKINQLDKVNNLTMNALDKVTNLTISLPDHAVHFDRILSLTKYLVKETKNLEQIYINLKQINQVKKIMIIKMHKTEIIGQKKHKKFRKL